jgi:hypothetical protein
MKLEQNSKEGSPGNLARNTQHYTLMINTLPTEKLSFQGDEKGKARAYYPNVYPK